MVNEASEEGMRGCFTVEYLAEACGHSEQFFTPPLAGPSTFSVRSGIALRMSGGIEEAHQLPVFVRDEVWQRRTQLVID
jgi:hypothetical protein